MIKSCEIYGKYLKEYMINDDQLAELKKVGVAMLKDLHNICVENGIYYSMVYGTLLGAVRHKGYIPWDDDIDVFMFRKDYQKFCDIIKKKYSEDYYVLDNTVNKNYNLQFPKLEKKKTLLIEAANDNKYESGCYIDIFLLDDAPKTCVSLKRKIYLVSKMAGSLVCDYKFPSQIVSQMAKENKEVRKYYKTRRFVGFFLSIFPVRTWYKLGRRMLRGKTCSDRLAASGDCLRILDKSLVENVKLYEYEGEQFYGISDYDTFLTGVYGDYMKLPPEEKRERHIIVRLDLNVKD